jgi:hypothetical protein
MASDGAQAQIALRGPQDVYLLAVDENTFWSTTYPRHTNFAVAEMEQNFNTAAGYGMLKNVATLGRNGDLVSTIYLYTELNPIVYAAGAPFNPAAGNYANYVNSFPHALIDRIIALIGNVDYDTHYGEFMEIMESLFAPPEKLMGEQNFRFATQEGAAIASTFFQRLWTPLRFWFCRFYEQALPYVALYWHTIDIELSTKQLSQLVQYGPGGAITAANVTIPTTPNRMTLLVNYVFLDKPERVAFGDGDHEYVFDQVQYLGPQTVRSGDGTLQHNIRFNHPVQELIWVCQRTANVAANDWFNFGGLTETGTAIGVGTTRESDPFSTAQIMINNHQRTLAQPAEYFRLVQPWQSHTRYPAADRKIYCYCFGPRPEEMFDTGSVNFSRLDNAYLNVTYKAAPLAWDGAIHIYARNKNVMKINSGMAGKKFAA